MNTTMLSVAVLVVLVLVGAIALVVIRSGGEYQAQDNVTGATGATSAGPGNFPATSPPLATVTTSQPASGVVFSSGGNVTIWDLYYWVERIVIAPYYSEELGELTDWPVLLNGTLYAVSDISVTYRITMSDGFNATLNMTWSLSPNQTFTAACADLYGNIISQETFYDVFVVSHEMTWTGGMGVSYTAYLINTSALYWYHTLPPMDVPDYGAWKMGVLGGGVNSDTGSLTWSCAAAKAPMDPDLIVNCQPYVEESGDVWAVFQDETFERINDEGVAFMLSSLSPPEIFDLNFLQILPSVRDTVEGVIPSDVPDYNKIWYSVTYLGKVTLPGEETRVDAWRIDFHTTPLFLNGSYILTASTITPLWYKVTVTPPDGPQFTIEYQLLSIYIMNTLSMPLKAYVQGS